MNFDHRLRLRHSDVSFGAKRKTIWGLFIVLGLWPGPPAGAQEEAPREPALVEEIRFEGLISRKPEEVISRLSLKVGEPFNPLLIREDLEQLARIMRRVNVRTESAPGGGIRLVFVVEEFPRLRRMQIIGNSKISTERIETLANLEAGAQITENVVRSLRSALEREYRSMGLTGAKVRIRLPIVLPGETDAESDDGKELPQTDMQIVIDEGIRIRVDDVVIEGAEKFSKLRLKFMMDTKGSWLFVKNYYEEELFEEDLIRLRGFYRSRGYFDALVERGVFEERSKKEELIYTPVVKIHEGERYRIGQIDVRGARLFSREEVLQAFEELKGEKYNGLDVSRAMRDAEALYFDSGFLATQLQPVQQLNPENQTVDLVVEIQEQGRIYVGDIRLDRPKYEIDEAPGLFQRLYERFAPPITDEAILREILLEPGEVYAKSVERDSVIRLRNLGVFSQVRIVNQPTSNPRVHDALISIEESPITGGLGAGVGFGDVSGGFFFASFQERNLFGDARDFRVQLQLGTGASNLIFSYMDRHFRDSSDVFTASVFYTTYFRPGYRETTAGVNAELSRFLYGQWQAALRGRLEYVSLDERGGIDAKEDLEDSYPVIAARLTLTHNDLYPEFDPSEGRILRGSAELGYADGPLIKFIGSADFYYPVLRTWVYRFMPMIGFMPVDSDDIGLGERFFLGGSEDLRGFEFRGAARRDDLEDEVGIGGAAKILIRNELEFPLFNPVSGVIFLDAGILGETVFDYDSPRASTGFGIRFTMQQATVAVDLAIPIVKQKEDELQFLHFSFNGAF